MPAFFNFGWFKNDNLTQGGSVSFGQNIVQNRNATKQNNGQLTIGDGFNNMPIIYHLNADPDAVDQNAIDAQNFGGTQA
ncbi:hypothetical protein [Effusibacillus pohliae]|uniref:hypothetical protein n=1 Tax=Effusibacillus pohliae TaxID=232270 RepID=UPI00036DA02C|nr:hypothetical protein [Effusibacillus pohliae]